MKKMLCIILLLFPLHEAAGDTGTSTFTLSEAIDFGLRNSPVIIQAKHDMEISGYRIDSARSEKYPHIQFRGGIAHSRYPAPVTPISGSPLAGSGFPEFDDTLYDFGLSFTMPLYRGGMLEERIDIAKIREAASRDSYDMNRQELIFNITSVFDKILQLKKLLSSGNASVRQLEAHRKNVVLFLQAGTIPEVELLKTETELAHARQNVLAVENHIESSIALLRTLMGFDDMSRKLSITDNRRLQWIYPHIDISFQHALEQRPDYLVITKKMEAAGRRIRLVSGKRLPALSLNGEYMERSGNDADFNDNWNIGLTLSVPIFDGGSIRSEVNIEKKEIEKLREEQRKIKQKILREVKDAYNNIENAQKRITVSNTAIKSAEESLRIEVLKFKAGAGTSTDVIDAQTALLRAETDYHQAVFDKNIAAASLRKAIGDDGVLVKEVVE